MDMALMFAWSQFGGDLSGWDVSQVESKYCMFVESPLEGKEPSWYRG